MRISEANLEPFQTSNLIVPKATEFLERAPQIVFGIQFTLLYILHRFVTAPNIRLNNIVREIQDSETKRTNKN